VIRPPAAVSHAAESPDVVSFFFISPSSSRLLHLALFHPRIIRSR